MRRLRSALVALPAALLAVVLAVALAACSSSGGGGAAQKGLGDSPKVGPYAGFGLVPPRPRPDFTLSDTQGKRYPFSSATQGKVTMLFFGYTNCPDICPATMADIRLALRKLSVAEQKQVTVVFVTTDVKHDSAPVITQWLRNFSEGTHATFVGLRGTQAQIDAAQATSHVLVAEEGGRTHSTQVLLFGRDDYARDSFVYTDNDEWKQMAHDLHYVVQNGGS